MENITIMWGADASNPEIEPLELSFGTCGEKDAYIAGADIAINAFPDSPEVPDEELKNYSEDEKVALCLALEHGDGWSDYNILRPKL